MSNGLIIGLPRLDGGSSAGTEYTEVWQRSHANVPSSSVQEGRKGEKGVGKGKTVIEADQRGDAIDPDRIVDKRFDLCRRCGQAGHDKYEHRAEECLVRHGVRCWECGRSGHHYKACMALGFNWEQGYLAHMGYVSRLEEEYLG